MDSHGSPLTNNWVTCNPFPELEASFGEEKCLVGVLSTVLLGDSLKIFIYGYILGSFWYVSFPYHPLNYLSFSSPSLYSLLCSLSSLLLPV